jgi:hypothetical protein
LIDNYKTDIAKKPVFAVKTSIKMNDALGKKDNLIVLYSWPGSAMTEEGKYLLPCYYTSFSNGDYKYLR